MTQKGDKRIQVRKLRGVAIKMTLLEQNPPPLIPAGRKPMAPANDQTHRSQKSSGLKRRNAFWTSGSLSCFYLAAPSEPPGNLRWEQQGSQVSLGWEPVRPLANESEVMGYKVGVCSFLEQYTFQSCHCDAGRGGGHEWDMNNHFLFFVVAFFEALNRCVCLLQVESFFLLPVVSIFSPISLILSIPRDL